MALNQFGGLAGLNALYRPARLPTLGLAEEMARSAALGLISSRAELQMSAAIRAATAASGRGTLLSQIDGMIRAATATERRLKDITGGLLFESAAAQTWKNTRGIAEALTRSSLRTSFAQTTMGQVERLLAGSKNAGIAGALAAVQRPMVSGSMFDRLAASIATAGARMQFDQSAVRQALAVVDTMARGEAEPRDISEREGQSFLVDAVAGAAAALEDEAMVPASDERRLPPTFLTALLETFHGYFAAAGSLYEKHVHHQTLQLVLAFVAIYLNQVAIDVARQAEATSGAEAALLRRTIADVSAAQVAEAERTRSVLEQILEQLADDDVEETGIFLVVERRTELWSSTRATRQRIGEVHPNQIVQLREDAGRWIKIEFFDHLTGMPRAGWVRKKYVRRMPVVP